MDDGLCSGERWRTTLSLVVRSIKFGLLEFLGEIWGLRSLTFIFWKIYFNFLSFNQNKNPKLKVIKPSSPSAVGSNPAEQTSHYGKGRAKSALQFSSCPGQNNRRFELPLPPLLFIMQTLAKLAYQPSVDGYLFVWAVLSKKGGLLVGWLAGNDKPLCHISAECSINFIIAPSPFSRKPWWWKVSQGKAVVVHTFFFFKVAQTSSPRLELFLTVLVLG